MPGRPQGPKKVKVGGLTVLPETAEEWNRVAFHQNKTLGEVLDDLFLKRKNKN